MMKKIFFFIAIFSAIFGYKIYINASSYYFVWENTNLTIPLNGNISDFMYLPKANLYLNGKIIEDSNISYLRSGNNLYLLDDVDTSTVGRYYVMYYAYDYDLQTANCDGYSQLICFEVVDDVPPTIDVIDSNLKLSYNVKSFDYKSYINVYDNNELVSYNIDDSDVKYGVVGNYIVHVYAFDGFQSSSKDINIKIVDETLPSLMFLPENKILEIAYVDNLEIDFHKYFKAIDEYDGNVIQSLEISDYDKTSLSPQILTARVNDNSNNYTILEFTLLIKDLEAPSITLKGIENIIYLEDIDFFNPYDYILNVSDNLTNLSIDDVQIEGELKKKIGSYKYTYKIKDDSQNETKKEIIFRVLSLNYPKITIKNPTIYVNDKFDVYKYISVYDDSDSNVINNLKIISSNLDTKSKGTYYIEIAVNNSSGNFSYATMCVKVVNNKNSHLKFYVFVGSVIIIFLIFKVIKKYKGKS